MVDRSVKALQELSGDGFLDDQPGPGHAVLARIVVLKGGFPGGCVEFRVGEHDERSLPAQFGRERDEVAGGRLRDKPARLG